MSLSIQCPSCAAQYEVSDDTQGKRVRCKKCQQVFAAVGATPVAAAPVSPWAASGPIDPLGGVDLSQFPALPAAAMPKFSQLPAQAAWRNSGGPAGTPEGPTDMQMRLVCAGMIGLGVILAIGSVIMHATTGTVYLMAVALIPLMLVLGVAGLISPNVVRACGKYGGHLPWQYKAAGWGVIGLSFVLMIALGFAMFSGGFRPDQPWARNRRPGLDRNQTTTVVERIRSSYAASPDANVVRTVSFPVFSINGPNPVAEAERVLAPVPGYVSGSFQITPDSKQATFQFKGDKQMATQYALLLPGPTGIFMAFEPVFKE